jgi:putative PIN family toxin of toxin-antitoxin system
MPDPLTFPIRIFIDTSVYISGLISETGASSAIIFASEAGAFEVHVNPQVLIEAREVLVGKFKSQESFIRFQKALEALRPVPVTVSDEETLTVLIHCNDPADAPMLASALKSGARYFITLDKKSFKRRVFGKPNHLKVITPGEFMKLFRRLIGERGC